MSFTKILCATDFSPPSQHALQFAAQLAVQHNAELVVAHAWYVPPVAFSIEAPFPAPVVQQIVEDAQQRLDAAVNDARALGAMVVTGTLVNGQAWAEIVRMLENQAFDLCVVGTHGRSGLSRVLLGSVAEKIVRHASCSVFAVRSRADAGAFRHILVPTDFSPSSDAAVELAVSMVAAGGKITLLHVVELPVQYASVAPLVAFDRDFLERARVELERLAATVRAKTKAQVATETQTGPAGAETLSLLANDSSIDLVIMGSHGRTGIKRALLGSVAEKVVRHADRPVLVARRRGE